MISRLSSKRGPTHVDAALAAFHEAKRGLIEVAGWGDTAKDREIARDALLRATQAYDYGVRRAVD